MSSGSRSPERAANSETDATQALRARDFEAAVFDLDGVVTRTAGVHAAAWKELFDKGAVRRIIANHARQHRSLRPRRAAERGDRVDRHTNVKRPDR